MSRTCTTWKFGKWSSWTWHKTKQWKKLILMRFKLTSPPTLFIQPHSTFIVSNEIWRKIDQDKILFRLLVIPFSSLITFCLVANSMQIMIIFIHKSTHIASWAENRTNDYKSTVKLQIVLTVNMYILGPAFGTWKMLQICSL